MRRQNNEEKVSPQPEESKQSPKEDKPKRGFAFNKNKNPKSPTAAKVASPKDSSLQNKKGKPIIGNKKPIGIKGKGMKGPNFNMHGLDSDDENDYPFDDGMKWIIQ